MNKAAEKIVYKKMLKTAYFLVFVNYIHLKYRQVGKASTFGVDIQRFESFYFSMFFFIWPLSFIIYFLIFSHNISIYSSMGLGVNKLIFIHVPTAWLLFLFYLFITFLAIIYLIRKDPIVIRWLLPSLSLSLLFNFITLFTGSIWANYTWGTYWQWEGRLTTVLILFILQFVILNLVLLTKYYESCILILFGLINLPLIKYSVDWWSGLHQISNLNNMDERTSILLFTIFLLLVLISGRIIWINYKRINLKSYLNLSDKFMGL